MSIESNKSLIRQYMDEPWNRGNPDIMDEICAPDCFAQMGETIPQFKRYILELRKSVPDFVMHIDLMIAEDDWVATRWRWTGANNGKGDSAILGPMPPAGKRLTYTGVTINRIAGGKIVSDIYESNWTDMLNRMGVATMPAK